MTETVNSQPLPQRKPAPETFRSYSEYVAWCAQNNVRDLLGFNEWIDRRFVELDKENQELRQKIGELYGKYENLDTDFESRD